MLPRRSVPLLLVFLAAAVASAGIAPRALEPPRTGGVELVDRALARLGTHARVLVVGAHPDDEDSSLLTLVAGMGGEAAYLSLSRGEGGQNLIGPELGVGLGLIRSEELLAARRLEGNRQYFTRAYDFGYTRSLDETLARWPRPALLEDAARVVRRFKPQVIVSIFRDGAGGTHGQHQAAGVVAHAIYELAGDPSFAGEGLEAPWTPQALYRRAAWWRGEEGGIEVALDGVDPIDGRGWGQVAAASRSMHRSQDMGRMQRPGGARTSVLWVAGGGGAEGSDLFAGIDTRLAAIADLLDPGEARASVRARLERVAAAAGRARGVLSPGALDAVVPALVDLRTELVRAGELAAASPTAAALIDEKRALAELAILAAAGVAIDARADRARVVPGEGVEVTATVWSSGRRELAVESARLVGSDGWRGLELAAPSTIGAGEIAEWSATVELDRAAPPTLPYFLRRPRDGDLYDWHGVAAAERGEAFGPPPLELALTLEIDGVEISVRREVVYAFADQARGEVRRPLQAVPAVEVEVAPQLVMVPSPVATPPRLEVRLRSNVDRPLAGRVEVELPEGWPRAEPVPFRIPEGGGGDAVHPTIPVPRGAAAGRFSLPVWAVLEDGSRYGESYPTIEYAHVRPRPRARASVVDLELLHLALPVERRIGWVRGASDVVPEALRDLGLSIDLLDGATLANAELSRYDVLVVGSRAYETDPQLPRLNEKLLEFARRGGTLIVQYQQYQFARGGFAPFAFEIDRPHDRITDETSPVRLLDPEHAVLARPNRLSDADWEGWVQERGLYFAGSWGPELTALLAMRDPGEEEQLGGLLVGRLGEGWYVYTGLSFFRQIPAGVPGAYRLLANLLALGDRS